MASALRLALLLTVWDQSRSMEGCGHHVQGVTSWFIFSLIKGRGVPGAEAAVRISGLELGGLLGSLSAGAISDRLIKSNTDPDIGNVGLRVKVARPFVSHFMGTAMSAM